MIVNFSTTYGQLTMLGEPAVALLKLGGHSGSVPSAILAADLPQFLQRLRAGLALHGEDPSPALPTEEPPEERDKHDAQERATVTLRMRAAPLLAMVETAIARGSDLMWERG